MSVEPRYLFVVSMDVEPDYTALYEIGSSDVPASDTWAEAVERGRLASHVRPHTSNRSHGPAR